MAAAPTRRVALHRARLREHPRQPARGRELRAQVRRQQTQTREVHAGGHVVHECPGSVRSSSERRVLQYIHSRLRWPWNTENRLTRPSVALPTMADDRVGHIAAAVAAQPRAIREIDVLVRREEVLVEAAELVEHGLRHQARRAAYAEHFFGDSAADRGGRRDAA